MFVIMFYMKTVTAIIIELSGQNVNGIGIKLLNLPGGSTKQ